MAVLEADIEVFLKARILDNFEGLRVIFPNEDDTNEKPYLFVQFATVNKEDDTHDGSNTVIKGRLIGTVVSKLNRSTREGTSWATDFAAIFPHAFKSIIPGGRFVVTKPPVVMEGFRQDSEWRTNVNVEYDAY